MHDCPQRVQVGRKAAQMGFTEWALNRSLFTIDVVGVDVLYVLPAKTPDASDFSAARFDPAIEASPYLTNLFNDVKNVGHKRAGNRSLYIRGSRSRSGLKSLPAGLLVFDEVDEMEQANIPLALERSSGQTFKQELYLSTPTIDDTGIDELFQRTNQCHFFFVCPHCGRQTELVYPDCLVIEGESHLDSRLGGSHLICKECKAVLDHKTKPDWLASALGLNYSGWVPQTRIGEADTAFGFYVSQLYSFTVSPPELAKAYFYSLIDPSSEQEFFNSKLGLPHITAGSRVDDTEIKNCIGGFAKATSAPNGALVTMGIDVGKWLHYSIIQWFVDGHVAGDLNICAKARLLTEGKVLNFEDLDGLMNRYRVSAAVCDLQPETRKAREFARRFYGRAFLCTYLHQTASRELHISPTESGVSADRTSWLDLTLGRFHNGTIALPMDVSEEFKMHIKTPVRVYRKDKTGNPIGVYVNGTKADHFAHSTNYAEIALPLAASMKQSQDINLRL